MKSLLLILLIFLGCTTGDISVGDIATGDANVIGSKNATIDYTKVTQEADNAKLEWKNYIPTEDDRKEQKKGEEEVEEYFKKLKTPDGISYVAFGLYVEEAEYLNPEFVIFVDRNKRVQSCRRELQLVYFYVSVVSKARILTYGCHRSIKKQLEHFKAGRSKVKKGQHNYNPSNAGDSIPLNAQGLAMWKDMKQIMYMVGIKKATCEQLKSTFVWNLECRSGADFNRNGYVSESGFFDPGHLEIRGKKRTI